MLLTAFNLTRTIQQWATDPLCVVSPAELQERLDKGWLPERALTARGQRKHSRFRGVSWGSRQGKWKAQIRDGERVIHLGWYDSETDAARAWNLKARELRGTDARINK